MPRESSLAERRAAVRERIAAEKERRARLPRALCGACGGVVAQGEGVVFESDTWSPGDSTAVDDRGRASAGLPQILGWRRRHDRCASSSSIVVQILGGDPLSDEIAGAALGSVRGVLRGPVLVQHRSPDGRSAALAATMQARSPRPWAHLTDDDRAALRWAVDRERAEVEPRPCVSGPCAWCGVLRSVGWRRSPEQWADGREAPLCGSCAQVWDRRGNPGVRDGLRACALEALSGANSLGSTGLDLLAYVDIADEDRTGRDEPWTYAEPLARLREEARLTWWASLPANLRDEYMVKAAEATRAAMEAQRAAEAAEAAEEAQRQAEAAKAAGWPV